jgi:hypothetical protein
LSSSSDVRSRRRMPMSASVPASSPTKRATVRQAWSSSRLRAGLVDHVERRRGRLAELREAARAQHFADALLAGLRAEREPDLLIERFNVSVSRPGIVDAPDR